MTDKRELEFTFDQLDASYNLGYYLNEHDIKRMIILIYRASGIEINKHDFIFITKRALNEFE